MAAAAFRQQMEANSSWTAIAFLLSSETAQAHDNAKAAFRS
jgi:hypothetical protein